MHTADSWMCNVGTRYLRALVASGPGPAWTAAQRTSVHAPASIMKKKHATFASLPHQQQSWEWNARGIDNCEIGMFVPPIDLQARPGFAARVSISSTAKKKKSDERWKGQEPSADPTWVYCDIRTFFSLGPGWLASCPLPGPRRPN